jgi:hypothetical protein
MSETLGLLEEAVQLARDLGYVVREEPLGDLPGGKCSIGGTTHVILNIEQSVAARLDRLLLAIQGDPRVDDEPKSRLLARRLKAIGPERPDS